MVHIRVNGFFFFFFGCKLMTLFSIVKNIDHVGGQLHTITLWTNFSNKLDFRIR